MWANGRDEVAKKQNVWDTIHPPFFPLYTDWQTAATSKFKIRVLTCQKEMNSYLLAGETKKNDKKYIVLRRAISFTKQHNWPNYLGWQVWPLKFVILPPTGLLVGFLYYYYVMFWAPTIKTYGTYPYTANDVKWFQVKLSIIK